jgi:hypothetical protein
MLAIVLDLTRTLCISAPAAFRWSPSRRLGYAELRALPPNILSCQASLIGNWGVFRFLPAAGGLDWKKLGQVSKCWDGKLSPRESLGA